MTLTPEKKKWIWIVGILAVIILAAAGSDYWQYHNQTEAEAAAHPCAINFLSTYLYNVSATTTKEMVARELLTQYLDANKLITKCPTQGIKDYAITSIGAPTDVQGDFTIPVSFDLLPISKSQTNWSTSETHWDGDWIRGKQATLGIQHIITSTSTNATSTYRLVI